jgi:hypothetical protein
MNKPTPISDEALKQFPQFVASIQARLETGKHEYGDSSFYKHPTLIIGSIQEELLDVCGWAFILYYQLLNIKEQLKEMEGTQ